MLLNPKFTTEITTKRSGSTGLYCFYPTRKLLRWIHAKKLFVVILTTSLLGELLSNERPYVGQCPSIQKFQKLHEKLL